MLCLSKPKKKGKKRTYYCYCCRVCCKSEWTERATTSRAIVGLLRYVMCTKVIWLITLLLCLAVWKGDRSNLNSIEWIFSLVRYFSSTTWCITVSHLSRGPELTLSYISLVAAVPAFFPSLSFGHCELALCEFFVTFRDYDHSAATA